MKVYKSFKYTTQDPFIGETLKLLDGETFADVSRTTGVSAGTLSRWKHKKSRRTFSDCLQAVGRAHGKKLRWVDDR